MVFYSVKRIVLESFPVLIASMIISLVAGYMLNSSIQKIAELPIILMMIPPINGLGGNIGSILGARLSSALHLGTLEPRLSGQRVLRKNMAASALVSFVIFSLIGAIFFTIAYVSGIPLVRSLSLALAFFTAGIVLTVAVIFATIISAFVSFRGGLDPDNVVIPIITSVGDVLGVTCLLVAIIIFGV